MTAARIFLVVTGVMVGFYGVVLLWDHSPTVLLRIAVWALVGVAVHDFVFAPLCVAAGFAGRLLLPARWQSPVAVAALYTVVLVVLAVPVYNKPGLKPDNPTVLDRNYPLGLWVSLAVVWACVPLYYFLARRLPVRQDQVVDQQGPDHVERQPPTV